MSFSRAVLLSGSLFWIVVFSGKFFKEKSTSGEAIALLFMALGFVGLVFALVGEGL